MCSGDRMLAKARVPRDAGWAGVRIGLLPSDPDEGFNVVVHAAIERDTSDEPG